MVLHESTSSSEVVKDYFTTLTLRKWVYSWYITRHVAAIGRIKRFSWYLSLMFGSKEKIRFNNYAGFWVNEKAFVAGAGLTSVIAMTGYYLSQSMLIQVESIFTPLLASIFTGITLGHYLGVSTEKEGRTTSSFGVGMFSGLSIVLLAYFQLTILSAIVLLTPVTVFLIHNSGLVVQNKMADKAVAAASQLSVAGLVLLAVYHYVFPILNNLVYFLLYDLQFVQLSSVFL